MTDADAFRELYREHTPALYLLALRLLGGNADAAGEAVQEAWVRAVRRMPAFRHESSLRTWLCGFVVNCAREQRRALDTEELDDAFPSAAGTRDGTAVDLERAIRALPDRCREVFVLYAIEGWTHAEVGHQLGIDEGTSKSQLHRARELLRATLGESHGR